jgi:chromosome segregation ATPase
MEEKVDILSKKRPTVNELKTEVIRLRKELDKSENGLNHYKSMFDSNCEDNKKLRQAVTNLKTSNGQLFSNNRELKDRITCIKDSNETLALKYDKLNKLYLELKAKKQYNTTGFVIASIVALAAIAVVILRLV